MTKKHFSTYQVVCLGTRVGTKNDKWVGLQRVDENEQLIGEIGYYSAIKNAFPGAIFSIEAELTDESLSTIHPSTLTFVKTLADTALSAKIKIEHEANETKLTAIKQAKKARTDKSDILDCLRPLRLAYRNTNHAGRLALEVRVLHYLRNDSDL
ncbi:hypothetical protein [Alteromonas macleodii]|uniref:Uncharacterized protein n=1 Tax=Alteromonas macleodii TaxID=28108 RepID=A0AB36FQR6_ALTMA|nr:hypothetical protein [Alteromonas macleodii]OES24042.1 hypothetical protein BFV95_4881 [Alteromonas macleodii]OES25371.1 hypothetical protein BFV93_4475 [Alteromonas macleodii]OES25720.1 hypothetical protein BFV94_4327 [Alteromonas macleodii]OES38602.1 hypothetical protein BFV96_4713 [Alteromonas macleodii]